MSIDDKGEWYSDDDSPREREYRYKFFDITSRVDPLSYDPYNEEKQARMRYQVVEDISLLMDEYADLECVQKIRRESRYHREKSIQSKAL